MTAHTTLADAVRAQLSVHADAEDVRKETLFGSETERRSLYVPRAQVVAALRKMIGADRRLLGLVREAYRRQRTRRNARRSPPGWSPMTGPAGTMHPPPYWAFVPTDVTDVAEGGPALV